MPITMAPRSWPNGKRLIAGEPYAFFPWFDHRNCTHGRRSLSRRQQRGTGSPSDGQLGRGPEEYRWRCRACPRRLEKDRGLTSADPQVPFLGDLGNSLVFRVAQRGGNLLLAEARPVVTINRQRNAPGLVQMACPGHRVIKTVELLEQEPLLLQRRHSAGAWRTAEHSISHGASSFAILMCLADNASAECRVPRRDAGDRTEVQRSNQNIN